MQVTNIKIMKDIIIFSFYMKEYRFQVEKEKEF